MGACFSEPKKKDPRDRKQNFSVLQTKSQFEAGIEKIKPERLDNGTLLVRTKNATAEVRRYYEVQDYLLGEGAFGKVFMANSIGDKTAKFAIKVMPVANLTEATREQMEQEIDVLNKLDHAYVCKYQHSF